VRPRLHLFLAAGNGPPFGRQRLACSQAAWLVWAAFSSPLSSISASRFLACSDGESTDLPGSGSLCFSSSRSGCDARSVIYVNCVAEVSNAEAVWASLTDQSSAETTSMLDAETQAKAGVATACLERPAAASGAQAYLSL
jgi:hypothetical protein